MNYRFLPLAALLLVVITSGAVCRGNVASPASFTMKYWTVYTTQDDITGAITAYNAVYPYAKIELRQFQPDEYEDKLIEAWAKNEGPDIFSLPNSHIGKFHDLIRPLPSTLNVTSVVIQKTFGSSEKVVTPQVLPSISLGELGSIFPQVVTDDVVQTDATTVPGQAADRIYGLPLSLDTLALYYNKDLLSKAKIPLPPASWDELDAQIQKLTLVDIDNNIVQAGIGLGTSTNVPYYFDIVSMLMMQSGAQMVQNRRVSFDLAAKGEAEAPALHALKYYTSFATPGVDWYTWTTDQPDALSSFVTGKTAMYIGYHHDLASIQAQAPNLRFDIAPAPQVDITNPVNYANYWIETVSVNSTHPDAAWAFIQDLTTNPVLTKAYADTTKKPAALKSLIATQQEDFVLNIFDTQALTARTWYTGKKPEETEQAFADMITLVLEGRLDVGQAVKNTAEKVQLTYEN